MSISTRTDLEEVRHAIEHINGLLERVEHGGAHAHVDDPHAPTGSPLTPADRIHEVCLEVERIRSLLIQQHASAWTLKLSDRAMKALYHLESTMNYEYKETHP